jgi:hypothetical protein
VVFRESGVRLQSPWKDVITFNLFIKKCYKYCVCKDEAALSRVTVQNRNGSCPSTLAVHTTVVVALVTSAATTLLELSLGLFIRDLFIDTASSSDLDL